MYFVQPMSMYSVPWAIWHISFAVPRESVTSFYLPSSPTSWMWQTRLPWSREEREGSERPTRGPYLKGEQRYMLVRWYTCFCHGCGCLRILTHDDVIKWKHFPRNWPFVRGIRRSPVDSHHKGQIRRALMFSVIYAWINSWANNPNAGDLGCHGANHDVTVMIIEKIWTKSGLISQSA